MRKINTVQIWKNGELKNGKILNSRIINDNLEDSCIFYWEIKEEDKIIPSDLIVDGSKEQVINGETLANGNCSIIGEEYFSWKGDNDTAYLLVANKINVTIIS